MAVKLLKQKDGQTWRPFWYGAYDINGRRKIFNTGVRWKGIFPSSGSLRDFGDEVFEATRTDATNAAKDFLEKARRKGRAEHLVERLIEAKTGRAVVHVKIADLAERWMTGPRRSSITEAHAKVTRSAFQRFQDFMGDRNRKTVFLYEVTEADAGAYIEAVRQELAPRTARGHVALVQSAFKRFLPVGTSNPFDGFGGRSKNGGGTVHRKPLSAAELQALIQVADKTDFMRDLITAAACSGMRRGGGLADRLDSDLEVSHG